MSKTALLLWGLLLSFFIAVPLFVIDGYVISKLWHWFVVPQFGLANLPIAIAIGIGILISYVTSEYSSFTGAGKGGTAQFYFFHLGRPALILLSGFIVHLFV